MSFKKGTIFFWLGFAVALSALALILTVRFQLLQNIGLIFRQIQLPQVIRTEIGTESQLSTMDLTQENFAYDEKNSERLYQGCLTGNDCIPSIDHPKFISARNAAFLKDDDQVLGVVRGNEVKAYPVKILNWHEIVNDMIDGQPVVVSYCPLTSTARAFGRNVEGETIEFGVSGMLLNSNLVMYDRKSNTLWNQFDGESLVGSLRETKLDPFQVDVISWKDWGKKYPRTMVLSTDTGFDRDYDLYPYGDYLTISDVYFPLEHEDDSFPAKETVYGIVIGDREKAYPEQELKKILPDGGEFDDEFAGLKLKVSYDQNWFRVANAQNNQEILDNVSFFFSWMSFYPQSEIFRAPSP